MAPIHILSVHLINKIAAGEVIERPASIVKELIENALDAGATAIDVVVEDGGKKLIAVTDNGGGMGPDDLAMAFAPHATSKIADESDLFDIHTLGFRGEALASIASVSHAHIRTRRSDAEGGCEVNASGDTVGDVRPCAAAAGTTATVRDLFFNTPARRKFMKTANTEISHISEQVTRQALPHAPVAFSLRHNDRSIVKLPAAASTAQRIADAFGDDLADTLMPISATHDGLDIVGLIGPPTAARSSGKWQYIFVNGRYIRDRLLSHALREAYRGRVDPNRWPVAFLFIQIAPDRVDVNVHPTKIEVRFQDSRHVHSALLGALRDALNKAMLAPTAILDDAEIAPLSGADTTDVEAPHQSLRDAMADFFRSAPQRQPHLTFPQSPHRDRTDAAPAAASPAQRAWPIPHPQVAAPATTAPEPSPAEGLPSPPQVLHTSAIQVHNTYLVVAEQDGLIIVDQHALHERILYNDLKRRLADAPLASQRLLIPKTLTVTAAEADTLTEAGGLLGKLGIVVEPFGPASVAVQQFPTLLTERKVEAELFLRDLLDTLADDETADAERALEAVLQLIACKAAVKAGDPLTPAEIEDLLARRQALEKGSACPHGRPTTLKLTLRDLEKQFARL
ncbi:hypothetical protein LCGC14_0284670 [marine sediment metagenome]|uniref:DNA mismatch repair protein S5 domain-containing protein n=1 Tax=marine sediment metagenome TaxID=412755 RepID=A0A0F9X0C7_9ZZZZ|nr:DNA mismatch repair endonuclease MutL [Phycisphaerae bacterium]HDZ45000.1 DNA mismatch repair endonuclease MutL [Phycisphaerae bacterium]